LRDLALELCTENKKLRDENAALQEAVAARDAFLVVAAHELRNPMTPIQGRIELLRRMLQRGDGTTVQVEKLVHGLEQVEWLIQRYVKRATTLLDVSRATSGKLHLDTVAVDLGALVREVAESFGPIADHAGSALEVQVPPDVLLCRADRLALEQAIDNLVFNAIKYGAGKSVLISVHAESFGDGQLGTCAVRICDHGDGISPEAQARIFDRFERAVRPGEHGGGFGVGLWIVRQLIEAMDGTVDVVSTPGQGSTFTLRLPRFKQASESLS